ncbi:MAG: zinc ribbon domain-containing protein [Myxococcota bacterium]
MSTTADDETPEVCPTCGTKQRPGAKLCHACGQVFGEANRCPHCNAIAAVRPTPEGHVCMACGKPREVGPGVLVIRPPASRAAKAGGRSLGIFAIAAGIVGGAIAAAAIPGVLGLVAAAAVAGGGLSLGLWGMRRGAGSGAEGSIRALAKEKGGSLFVTDVAEALGMSEADADAALTAMADGTRVRAEVTSDGLMRYDFREVRTTDEVASAAPRVRVADPLEERFAELEERLAAEAKEAGREVE